MRVLVIVSGLAIAIISFLVGYIMHSPSVQEKSKDNEKVSQIREGGYQFISPLLECEYDQEAGRAEFASLDRELTDYTEKQKAEGAVTDAAIYYRDLNNGPWFGVNGAANFSPSSLLKLPVMMAYFKAAETHPSILTTQITYNGEGEKLPQNIVTGDVKFEKGKQYIVGDVIKYMIIDSSNVALAMLEEHIDPKLIDKITTDLDIATPTDPAAEDFMSVKSYASLFRVLYNASYLNKEYSELALKTMSESKFKNGIVNGIPPGVKVAHKFGERELANGVKQLHDCGIVYAPRSPYLLCIMTRGKNLQNLSKTISDISSITYKEHSGL